MGRNGQPIDILTAAGRKHLTKAEIQHRKESQIKIGFSDLTKLKPPLYVKSDPIAFKHWKDCIKEFKSAAAQGVEILTSSDVGMLAMYCKTYSEYERLLVQYQRIENIVIDVDVLDEFIDQAELDGGEVNYKALRYLSQLATVEGILKIETAINKKMDMILKMQDRLFLNPLSKVKNVPKPKKDDKPVSKFNRFNGNS